MLIDENLNTLTPPDSKSQRKEAKNQGISVYPIRNFSELCSAFNVVYEQYNAQHFIKAHPSGLNFSLLQLLDISRTFIVKSNDKVVATAGAVLHSKAGIPSSELYKGELEELTRYHKTIAECTLFACNISHFSKKIRVIRQIINETLAWISAAGTDYITMVVNPRHVDYWRKAFGFEITSDVAPCPRVCNNPGFLLKLDTQAATSAYTVSKNQRGITLQNHLTESTTYLAQYVPTSEDVSLLLTQKPEILFQGEAITIDIVRQVYPDAIRFLETYLAPGSLCDCQKAKSYTPQLVELDLKSFISKIDSILSIRAKNRGVEFRIATDTLVTTHVNATPHELGFIISKLASTVIDTSPYGISIKLEIRIDFNTNGASNLKLHFHFDRQNISMSTKRIIYDSLFALQHNSLSQVLKNFKSSVETSDEHHASNDMVCLRLKNLPLEYIPTEVNKLDAHIEVEKTIVPTNNVKRILIARDSSVLLRIPAKCILADNGHDVTVAQSIEEFWAHFTKGIFDIIVIDMRAEVLKDSNITREIRKLDFKNHTHTTIVGLCSYGHLGTAERYHYAQVDATLNKPLIAEQLIETITKLSDSKEHTTKSNISTQRIANAQQ